MNTQKKRFFGKPVQGAALALLLFMGFASSLQAGTNVLGGTVFMEEYPDNGAYDVGEILMTNVTVHLYADTNCNQVLDAGEMTPLDTTTTDGFGQYSFVTPASIYSTESRVSASTDDAEERVSDGVMYLDSTDLELVYDPYVGGLQIVGMRFNDMDIPQGATIVSAYIEFETDETDNDDPSVLWIRGEDTDDAPTFTDTDYDISSRTKTTNEVLWSGEPQWDTVSEKHQTPDVSTIIQEIIDRSGWSVSNSLALFIDGIGRRVAESYDGDGNAPLLVVEYREPPSYPVCYITQAESAAYTSSILNQGTVTFTEEGTDIHTLHLGLLAGLFVEKTVSPTGNVETNQTLTYTITVSNLSSVAQTNLVITDLVPDGTTYVPGTVTNADDPPNLVTAGDGFVLETGAVKTVTFDVTVDAVPGVDAVENTVTVSSDQHGISLTDSTTNPILGAVTGHLYLDTNGNGTQDGSETNLPHVDVVITDSLGGTQTVTTAVNGDYTAIVPSGNTITDIDETDPDYPAGTVQTEGTDPTSTSVVAGTNTFAENDGFYPPASIGDRVWEDVNGNGRLDGDDPGLLNVIVTLYDTASNIVATTETDASGNYLFDEVFPGDYILGVYLDGWTGTLQDANDDDERDSDVDPNTLKTGTISLSPGETNLWVDAGLLGSSERADVGISKSVNDAAPMATQTVLFNLIATNHGPDVAPSVQITDQMPSGLTYLSDNGGGAYTSSSGVWNIGTMNSGDTASLSILATVDSGTEGDSLTNRATITQVGVYDTNAANRSAEADLTVQDSGSSPSCGLTYLVADVGGANGGDDLFTVYDPTTGTETAVGTGTGTDDIETIAFNPATTTLYAANADELGTINRVSGVYTTIGSFGSGDGAAGNNIGFNDVDGLTFDPASWVLYGAVRQEGSEDLLIQINPVTGAHIPDAFGTGVDYVVINEILSQNDIDDIAIDPFSGQMYGIANSGGGSDRLVKIDKLTGVATDVGLLGVNDHEGLSFSNFGQLYGTTGSNAGDGYDNSLFDVSTSTGAASNQRPLTKGSDYEAVETMLCPPNRIEGTVFLDSNEDGFLDSGDIGSQTVTVNLYRDVNGDGAVDAGDILLTTQETDANGEYSFLVAATGAFVLNVDTSTLESGFIMTTDNGETADFGTGVGLVERHNDFGYTLDADLSIQKTVSPTGNVTTKQTLTYTITVTNTSSVLQTDLIITDLVPEGTTYVTGTATVDAYVVVSDTMRDDFSVAAMSNQDGSINWAADWVEVGENDDFDGGDIQITSGDLRLQDNDNGGEGAYREANLSDVFEATLSLEYRRVALDDLNDYVTLSISTNSGTSWIELDRFQGPDNDPSPVATNYNISAYTGGSLLTRVLTSPTMGKKDSVYFNYVEILATSTSNVVTAAHPPPNLVTAADGFVLEPGAVMSVTFAVTVDAVPGVDAVENTATVTSDQQLIPLTDSTTNPILGAVTGHLYFDTNGNGTQDGGEPDLSGVDVLITDSLGGTQTVTTAVNGDYTAIVPSGNTITDIDETDPDYPAGMVQTEGTDPTSTLVVAGTTTFAENDGFSLSVSIGDRIWFDANGDGIQTAGETNGYGNITVDLLNTNGAVVATTFTDSNGEYLFENQMPGTYRVRFDLSTISTNAWIELTDADQGSDDALDSDVLGGAIGEPVETELFALSSGTTNLTVDLGIKLAGSTVAVISAVRSRLENGVALISWDVELEIDTAGYWLERWVDGEWVRINTELIRPQWFVSGTRTYEQADSDAPLGTVQRYQIVELDNQGRLLPYGPYDLALDGGEVSFDTWSAEFDWNGADSDPDADPDGDGLSNFHEYLSGTDPLNANSVLRITRVAPANDGVEVSWQSEIGRFYTVEMSLSLAEAFWPVATGLESTPPENSWLVPVNPSSLKKAFFRVWVEQAD